MEQDVIATHLENLDRRLAKVEQILPTLATKDELRTLATRDELKALATKAELAAAIAPLATKAELAAAIAPLATKAELAAAIVPLATKEDLKAYATRNELLEEGERSRLYMKVLIERQDDKLQVIAEHVLSLMPKQPER